MVGFSRSIGQNSLATIPEAIREGFNVQKKAESSNRGQPDESRKTQSSFTRVRESSARARLEANLANADVIPNIRFKNFLLGYGISMPINCKKFEPKEEAQIYDAILKLSESGFKPFFSKLRRAFISGYRPEFDAVKTLIQYGLVVPNHKNATGNTLLHKISIRATSGSAAEASADEKELTVGERISLLIAHGADVNARNEQNKTPLECALEKKDESMREIGSALIQARANLELIDKDGNTLLHRLVEANNIQGVQLLLEHNDEVKMLMAMFSLNENQVKVNLAQRVKLDSQNRFKQTPLHIAAKKGDVILLKILLEKNSEVVNIRSNGAKTALHLAAQYCTKPEILHLLLKHGADSNARDNFGYSALHLAAQYSTEPEMVSTLLEDEFKVAKNLSNKENLKAKLEAKADSDITPLHCAAMNQTGENNLKILLLNGADKNAKNKHGITALLYAKANNSLKENTAVLLKLNPEIDTQINQKLKQSQPAVLQNSAPESLAYQMPESARSFGYANKSY